MKLPFLKSKKDNQETNLPINYEQDLFVEKNTFNLIFVVLVLILMFLPFVTTFNEILTKIVERAGWYSGIRDTIVPYLVRMVVVVLKVFSVITDQSMQTITIRPNAMTAGGTIVYISWNCVGWQSFILFALTLFTGFQGNFTAKSKFFTLLFGLLGTFWINVFRISFIILIAHWWGRLPAVLFHDYGGTILIIIWLFIFWWLSYSYILEKKLD
ncbi:MAG: exosortase/archaeosortase family protein [bacterium]|nr:exosortase/archaeosortase family protein [bacterium]